MVNGPRRILFVSEEPLTEAAHSFLNRSSIEVDTVSSIDLALKHCAVTTAAAQPDLVIIDAEPAVDEGRVDAMIDSCSDFQAKILALSSEPPTNESLEKVEAFLVEPYSQGELIGTIGELLGTELRRALRMGVKLPGRMKCGNRKVNGTVLQLSETGCLLELESPTRVGDEISLSFVLPSNREQLSLGATVVSANELQLLYGVKFAEGFETERLAILVFVELGLAGGASEAPGGGTNPT